MSCLRKVDYLRKEGNSGRGRINHDGNCYFLSARRELMSVIHVACNNDGVAIRTKTRECHLHESHVEHGARWHCAIFEQQICFRPQGSSIVHNAAASSHSSLCAANDDNHKNVITIKEVQTSTEYAMLYGVYG